MLNIFYIFVRFVTINKKCENWIRMTYATYISVFVQINIVNVYSYNLLSFDE